MKNLIICFTLISVFFVGCRSIIVNKKTQHSVQEENTPVAIGVIGLHKRNIVTDYFEVTGIPKLNKIRLRATSQKFTQKTYNKYSKQYPDDKYNIKYVDSLDNKPNYLNFQFLDNIKLLDALISNEDVLAYLKTQNSAKIVSEVSMVVTKSQLETINKADALFLKSSNTKNCVIEMYTDNNLTGSFKFNEGLILGYRLSDFCWGTNEKNKQTIFDIIPEGDSCPGKTKKSFKKDKEQSIKAFTRL